jgi:hypothetical protein
MYSYMDFSIIFIFFFTIVLILKIFFNKNNYRWNKITLFLDSFITLLFLMLFVFVSNYIGFWDIESRVTDVWIQTLILLFTWAVLPYIYIKIKKKLITKVWWKPTDKYCRNEFLILFISILITLVVSAII